MLVAFYHFNGTFHFPVFSSVQIIGTFWLMVDLFFVLSGFVIVYNYKDKLPDSSKLGNFYIRRIGRLYPLFFVTTLFFFLEPLLELVQGSGGDVPFTLSWSEAFAYFFMFQGFGFTDRGLLNYASWSIGVEVQLYIIFSLFIILRSTMFIVKKYDLIILALMSVLSLLFIYLKYGTIEVMYEAGLARGIMSFSLGSIIALLTERFRTLPKTFGNISAPIVIVAIISLLLLRSEEGYFLLPYLFGFLVFILVFCPESFINKALEFKPLIFLGTISYSLYLNHPILIKITSKFFRMQNPSVMMQVMVTMAYLIILIVMSKITFELIEQPFIKLFNRKFKTPVVQNAAV